MVDIFQKFDYKYSQSEQYYEFLVCTHRKRLLPPRPGTEVFTPCQLPGQAYYIVRVR